MYIQLDLHFSIKFTSNPWRIKGVGYLKTNTNYKGNCRTYTSFLIKCRQTSRFNRFQPHKNLVYLLMYDSGFIDDITWCRGMIWHTLIFYVSLNRSILILNILALGFV